MAGISTSIEIADRVSGSLNKIITSLYNTTSAFESADRASDNAFDASSVRTMVSELYKYEDRIEALEKDLINANNRLEDMGNELRENRSAASGLQDAFGKIAGVVAAIGIGSMIKNEVSSAISYASDLSEVQNVVDTTFSEGSEAVNKWSKTTLEAFGLNELSAKQFSGTMGAMLKSSGLAGDTVQDMAMKITELSGDMASFYNLDAEEAFNKIRSGISGETEPLKQLGINMSVANLEAYALSQGITTAYSEMSQAEQVTLRYNYLLQATADAQGDFSRTSGSYANQIKLLKENWQGFTGELAANVLPLLANGIGLLNNGVSFIRDNWTVIQPIMIGLLTLFGAYITALVTYNAIKLGVAIVEGVHAAATMLASGATFAATAAQYGFNAALLACPITWIVILIVALIAAVIAFANHIAKTSDVATSAFGVICGGVNVVLQFFKNLGLWVANIALGIGNAIAAVASNMLTAFGNAISGVKSWFYGLLSTALTVVAGIAEALNKLPFVNFDYSGITAMADDYASKAAAEAGNKGEYKSIGDAFGEGYGTFETFGEGWAGDAFKAGAAWGDGVADKVSDKIDGLKDIGGGVDGLGATGTGVGGAGSVANNTGKTADNTGKMVDSVDISNENLKYMRDIAERDVINRFTTAEIKVDMQNNNNINNSMDIDGIVKQLTDGVTEAMEQAAEGVHE